MFHDHLVHFLSYCEDMPHVKPAKQVLELSKGTDGKPVEQVSDTSSEATSNLEEHFRLLFLQCQPLVISGLCQFISCYMYLTSSTDILSELQESIVSSLNKLVCYTTVIVV